MTASLVRASALAGCVVFGFLIDLDTGGVLDVSSDQHFDPTAEFVHAIDVSRISLAPVHRIAEEIQGDRVDRFCG